MTNLQVAIVVPVYRNRSVLEACLSSLLKNENDSSWSIILVNDCSPEIEVQEYCRKLADHSKVDLLENEENLGFVHSVNRGMQATDTDVILLNSDTVVPAGWIDRILATAGRYPDAATITPFTNNGTICSYPNFCEENTLPAGLSLQETDNLFRESNAGRVTEIPTGVGFCMYIRRAALNQVGYFDSATFGRGYGEENDFCMRAAAKGWKHLLAGDVYVFHEGSVSFGDEASALQDRAVKVLNHRYPNYENVIAEHVSLDPARSLRERVDEARLSLAGQSHIVLFEARARLKKISIELQNRTDVLEKELCSLGKYADARSSEALEYADRIQTLERELGRLGKYAENRANEADQYASRIKQYEATLSELGGTIEQYETLLAEARKAYQDSMTNNSALLKDNHALRSMLSVRIQLKLMQLMGKR